MSDLQSRITNHFDSLSPKQRAIARLILDNRYFASFASAAEIGEKVDASAATVVRLCQVLGYEGLPTLQEAIRQELPSYLTAVERLERRLTVPGVEGKILQRVFETDQANLERTLTSSNEHAFEDAVALLTSARETRVVGSGVTATAALFLAYSMQVMGYRAQALSDGDVALAVQMAHVQPGDVVVAISVWRYVRSTVEIMGLAKAQGAATIAITDSMVSPLARQADLAFEVATDGTAHSLSLTAMISLLNALIAGISLSDPGRTSIALRRVDLAFHSRDLLLEQ